MSEAGRIRKKQMLIHLTEDENKYLAEKAAYCGITKTEYLRKMIIDGAIIKMDYEGLDKLCYELNRIGNNINQIAYFVNSTKMFSRMEFKQLEEQYRELLAVIEDNFIGGMQNGDYEN